MLTKGESWLEDKSDHLKTITDKGQNEFDSVVKGTRNDLDMLVKNGKEHLATFTDLENRPKSAKITDVCDLEIFDEEAAIDYGK